ncbi:substrate-binding periplasmic protein [Wenzhouxiangella marina]|uniref:Polar amino acid transport system permease protein n=1 Tax=Wenzhouxiangella marina TaxID=1579979 RepID=A0A0K0XT08_9GAMM|nr:transporter substrate-binding domain-containing protein [Wenzhouxiangella marina]AKS40757.1 Polar amino acid transport system permease protein [Wenzhouxiangella marina]MBB6087630.1 polar amino acid transport system substrate-binding protein [Wenzhouxiangella marina]
MRHFSALLLASLVALSLAACQPASEPAPEAESTTAAAESRSAPECHLSMGWDPWEPYHFSAAGGSVQGLDVELVRMIGERIGCQFDLVQGNWADLLHQLQSGGLDVLAGATRTPERESFARFSIPYREERFALFVRGDELDRWAGRPLETLLEDGFRAGITQGYVYPEAISALQSDPRFEGQFIEAPIGELNFNALLDYRIDGFFEDPFVAAAIQRRRSAGEAIEPLDLDFGSGEVQLLFSRQSVADEQVEAVNAALQAMKDDGSYAALLERYLN